MSVCGVTVCGVHVCLCACIIMCVLVCVCVCGCMPITWMHASMCYMHACKFTCAVSMCASLQV